MMLLAFQLGNYLIGLFGHLFVDVFALFIVFIDVFCLSQRTGKVLLNQEVYALLAILHAARSIDTRAYFEHDVTHGDVPSIEVAYVYDGLQTNTWVLVQLFQTMKRQYSVFVCHGYNVGRDAHCAEIEQGDEP